MTRRPAAARASRLVVTVVAAPNARGLTRGLGPWLAKAAPARARGTVVVAVIPDRRVRALNRQFRRVDAATDVLSFPGGPGEARVWPWPTYRHKQLAINHLGDIAIAAGVARRQAASYGHPPATEIRLLALHGLLHLLGYDHERDQGQMQRLEARLRRRTHLPAGLLSRTPAGRSRR
jgi:probable rRNA maturation factor